MGFHAAGQTSLRNNSSLRRTKRRPFLDKDIDYTIGHSESAVNEVYRETLEKENKMYWQNKFREGKIKRFINRIVIVFILSLLVFGGYQLCVLFSS